MRDKLKLTKELISKLPYSPDMITAKLFPVMWKNVRVDGGMRLTTQGYDVFKHLEVEQYSIKLDALMLDTKLIMALDRKLQHPYYIKYSKNMPVELILFDSSEAMLANLYGDLKKFLDNYS